MKIRLEHSLAIAIIAACCLAGRALAQEKQAAKAGAYPQEMARHYTVKEGLPSNNVFNLYRSPEGELLAITDAGHAVLKNGKWKALPRDAKVENAGTLAPASVNDLTAWNGQTALASDQGVSLLDADHKTTVYFAAGQVNQLAADAKGALYGASQYGIVKFTGAGSFDPVVALDDQGRQWGARDALGVAFDSTGALWFAVKAGVVQQAGDTWKFYTGEEGLPYNDFTCLAAGPNGVMWMGTHLGAIRFDGKEWEYRQGGLWLADDDVRDIEVDADGAAWIATPAGVSCIYFQTMTLAEKAAFYEEEMEKYIRRTEYGYVSEVGLKGPGDKSEIIYNDSDNDGLWTSMYGAGECFAYAATKDPKAKDRAKRAFEALRFLQKVTQESEIKPPHGYAARTIRGTDLPDPNIGRVEDDIRKKAEEDSEWKVYEPRWPKTKDGKWYWKSDTSSDELDGHYFFYPAYYDLAAETEEEKERVREVVRDLTDHMLEHNYTLIDHDGKPTRWSDYSPESLNHSWVWWPERGLKSLSMLSYLTVAEHMTGDAKYTEHIKLLREQHAFDTNAMITKVQYGIGSGNQSDDEMAIMSYYNLVKYTKDPELKHDMIYSFYAYWTLMQPEMNPFYNFAFAALGSGFDYREPWGIQHLAPWEGWLEDSMDTLFSFPLDRCDWGHENSHRLDIELLPRQNHSLPTEPYRMHRGLRNNGKVLPVENRFFHHWNTDPWHLDYPGNGQSLGSGTVFLLPYYMGLYHGFIVEE
ncbi:MAG: hypothetical protein HYV27_09620 [Candidatus Hydrogenedentes bacterium]|nr:hypothetical protein [Candidatus Hydrogenedentota bacterium]